MREIAVCAWIKREHSQITEPPQTLSLHVCVCRCKEWDDVDKTEKERIHLKTTEDGEFWYVTEIARAT